MVITYIANSKEKGPCSMWDEKKQGVKVVGVETAVEGPGLKFLQMLRHRESGHACQTAKM